MTVAVDTNILFDILYSGSDNYESSRIALRDTLSVEGVIVGEAVLAEFGGGFREHSEVSAFLSRLGIIFAPSSPKALHRAGLAFRNYARGRGAFRCAECGAAVDTLCPRCASPVTRRQHLLPDFMIGAHALVHAGRLLTRDRGYYRTYFPDLVLV